MRLFVSIQVVGLRLKICKQDIKIGVEKLVRDGGKIVSYTLLYTD